MGIELTRIFVPLRLAEFGHVVATNGQALPSQADSDLAAALHYPHAVTLCRGRAIAPRGDGACLLVKVEVVSAYLQRLEPALVGRGPEVELRIPAAALATFSRRIARPISLLHAFYGPGYAGRALPGHSMFGDDIRLFLSILDHAPLMRGPAPPRPRVAIGPFTELEREWQRLLGVREAIGSTAETLGERLLGEARPWLLSNLGFWCATGKVRRSVLVNLQKTLGRRFPHPAPSLRGTLVD